jgi:hypothetical protein
LSKSLQLQDGAIGERQETEPVGAIRNAELDGRDDDVRGSGKLAVPRRSLASRTRSAALVRFSRVPLLAATSAQRQQRAKE